MSFLSPNQQRQSTKEINSNIKHEEEEEEEEDFA